jgi:DUF177 domain-containing protein
MLRVDLGMLSRGPVDTVGEIPAQAEVFAGLEFSLKAPVRVTGRLMASGPGSYYWNARLEARLQAECRRCLRVLDVAVDREVRLFFTDDEEADDPSAYPLPAEEFELDLTVPVREELILAAPGYPLCRDDCPGLCPRCGKDLNAGACACVPERDPRWKALEGLDGRA